MSGVTFGVKHLFSRASRDRFVKNLKNHQLPFIDTKGVKPTGTAAVLVPLCGVNNVPSLLYTVRSAHLRSHSGHISFPGGKTDGNETPIETAVRETQEEIGLLAGKIDVWGYYPVIPTVDYKTLVTPVIGCIEDLDVADLCLNKSEVNEVFTVPLEKLCDPKVQFHNQFSQELIVPVFMINEFKIWGITAYMTHMVLSGLLPKNVYKSDWMKRKMKF